MPRVGLCLLVAGMLCVGCDDRGTITVPAHRDIGKQIAKMRARDRPFFFAGQEFAGLPLTAARSEDWRGGGLFVYGTGSLPVPADGGCAPPAQIQIFRFDAGLWSRAVNCHRLPSLLGVPTVRHDGLVLFSKGAIIKIYARTHAEDRRLALSLRDLDRPGTILRRLTPPAQATVRLIASVCR